MPKHRGGEGCTKGLKDSASGEAGTGEAGGGEKRGSQTRRSSGWAGTGNDWRASGVGWEP